MLNSLGSFLSARNTVASGAMQMDKTAKPFLIGPWSTSASSSNHSFVRAISLLAFFYLIKADTDRRTWISPVMMHLLRLIGGSF